MTPKERYLQSKTEKKVAELGNSPAVRRFLTKYGNLSTKFIYVNDLVLYQRHLREEGILLTPDELLLDNLRCQFDSAPTDVATKSRHTDWLNEYINDYLLNAGAAEMKRVVAATAIKRFYFRSNSPLFGDFEVSRGSVPPPAKPLLAEDIREVLKALPLNIRAPLLCVWQSGIEIGRVLSLRWKDVEGIESGECPLKVECHGRKKHRRPYYTYFGRNAIEHIKLLRENWPTYTGRAPSPDDPVFVGKNGGYASETWLNQRLRGMAVAMMEQGIVRKQDPRSWHSHSLRHSFNMEAAHAGVRGELRDFFSGHIDGIKWVYDHQDANYPNDLLDEYRKLEPWVSLDYTEATLKRTHEAEKGEILLRVQTLEKALAELRALS